jgi:hypothetical protein
MCVGLASYQNPISGMIISIMETLPLGDVAITLE